MEWNVYYFNCNRQKIETFNIFDHYSFVEYVNKWLKECKTKEELAEHLKTELFYHFDSKCEYELVIVITEDNHIFLNPWVGCREPDKVRIDVTDDNSFDWRSFAEHHIFKQVYKNEAKIDVRDQVMWNFDAFVDYVWSFKSN